MGEQLGLGFSVEEMTSIPEATWTPPAELPGKLHGDAIAIDTETKDLGLGSGRGPGWPFPDGGYVAGYAIAADNFRGYLPIRHEGGGNLDIGLVHRWLNRVLGDETQDKVFANAKYDLGWAWRDGVTIKGRCWDVQWAEALLDENRWGYALNGLAKTYLNETKYEEELNAAARAFGINPKSEMWKLPAPFVGPYGEADADLTLRIWELQKPKLQAEQLWPVCTLEHDLLPMYMDMRQRGVRVDIDLAVQLRDRFRREVTEIQKEIKRRTGVWVELWTASTIARAFDTQGLRYPLTEKTQQPSITKQVLQNTDDHWLSGLILRGREKDKLAGTFLNGILDRQCNGRIHAEIHPLRSDDGGTGTGRLSMSDPNLQQIPTRTEEGRLIRQCFLPEEGELWASADFSQQEPRLLVHFASLVKQEGEHLPGAIEARDRYREDPELSYHQYVSDLTGLDYKRAKILNLAIIYGRGVGTTAEELNVTREEAQGLLEKHEKEMPFAKALARVCQDRVRQRGYIRSLLGRRVRFTDYEPADWDLRTGNMYPLWKAKQVWGREVRFVRARVHKALNSLIQPSAADQTKTAMRTIWQEGLGHHVLIQVHDELNSSVPDHKIARQIQTIMEEAVPLEVPSKADLEVTERWMGKEVKELMPRPPRHSGGLEKTRRLGTSY